MHMLWLGHACMHGWCVHAGYAQGKVSKHDQSKQFGAVLEHFSSHCYVFIVCLCVCIYVVTRHILSVVAIYDGVVRFRLRAQYLN